jgi:arylsulfatase A-like enzyme
MMAMLSLQLMAKDKPNILFIAVDDLRPTIGAYGNSIIKKLFYDCHKKKNQQ